MPILRLIHLACAAALLGPALHAQQVDTAFVTVHGHRMAFYSTRTTGPTVLLEAAGGSIDWRRVVPGASTFARVVTYDRPGFGLSEACDSARTAERVGRELHEALAMLAIREPLLMAGWSLGGAYARVFAGQYPQQVRGLVLVDPAPDRFYLRAAQEHPEEWSQEVLAHFRGLFSDSTRRTKQREQAAWDASMEQTHRSDVRHRVRTVVLVAARETEIPADVLSVLWRNELERWARSRPNTEVRIVTGSGHDIPRTHPDHVVAALRSLLPAPKR